MKNTLLFFLLLPPINNYLNSSNLQPKTEKFAVVSNGKEITIQENLRSGNAETMIYDQSQAILSNPQTTNYKAVQNTPKQSQLFIKVSVGCVKSGKERTPT